MTERLEFYTECVGRFVSGDIINKRTKDHEGRPIPEDKQRFEFGVAFDKAQLWPMLTEQWYPWLATQLARDQNALNRLQQWFTTMSGFSMKVQDGDKPNDKGQINENTKGCFVIYFASSYAPKTVGPDLSEIDPTTVKRGYYVQVAGNIAPNEQPGDRAGIYLNCNVVRLIAEGDVIAGGVDPAAAFKGAAAPAQLPPGARPLGSSSPAAGQFGLPGVGVGAAPTPPAPPSAPGLPGVPAQPAAGGAAPSLPGVGGATGFPGNPPAHPGILNPPLPGTGQ